MNVAGNLSLGVPKQRPVPTRNWADRAACRGYDPNLWFLDDPGGTYRTARQICADCPVRIECLAWAVETNTEFGLWGGLAPWERKPLRRKSRDPKATMSGRRFLHVPCPRCGHGPFGWHKHCAACRHPRPSEAGHLGDGLVEQVVLAVIPLAFVLVLLRLLGVAL